MMLDIKTLLPELKKLVTDLSEDLLARSTAKNDPYSAKVDTGLREAYAQIEKGGRTADAFEVWREDYLDQVAVAWVLGCVFVRFMEDNHLIDECWLAGEGERRKLAEDTHELYFREHPHDSDREYFEYVFHEVGKIPACRDLFAEGKTPLWAVGPSPSHVAAEHVSSGPGTTSTLNGLCGAPPASKSVKSFTSTDAMFPESTTNSYRNAPEFGTASWSLTLSERTCGPG